MLSDYLKTFPHYLLPKQALTTFSGFLANVKKPAIKNHLIRRFIRQYGVNMSEALEETPENYACFNDFFIRHLKPECRPISTTDIVSPVDGFVSEIGDITAGKLLQAKGRYYSVPQLLTCEQEKSSSFNQGRFATLYLSPKDYHRVHMPIEATLKDMIYVPGKLFSVQPVTSRTIPHLFARNERLVIFFDTAAGLMAMVLVGATIVGGIGTSWHGDIRRGRQKMHFIYPSDTNRILLPKAAEMGYFKLGSTVILLFAENQRVEWLEKIHPGSRIHFGEALATLK
ncbi:archaetidylserine decarboxylase [Legionella nagasakiensis]|uniref:archaetidylserine decarboxylase n=1 Tax=Legionella nagasakiensis TaxID=535290 RepID=UPI00105654E9|nr:archaetidylserine decarboxylase [Legionella nagasakiensis]